MRRARTLNSILEPLDGWMVDVGGGWMVDVRDGGEVVDLEAVSVRYPDGQSRTTYLADGAT